MDDGNDTETDQPHAAPDPDAADLRYLGRHRLASRVGLEHVRTEGDDTDSGAPIPVTDKRIGPGDVHVWPADIG
jgi:hypothetical protein